MKRKISARQNIERALCHPEYDLARYIDLATIEERDSKHKVWALAQPELKAVLLARRWPDGDPRWIEDLPCLIDRKAHPGVVASVREGGAVMPAMQICFLSDFKSTRNWVEIDIDLANPFGGDVASFGVHAFAEVLNHRISEKVGWLLHKARILDKQPEWGHTSQARVAEWLDRRLGPETRSATA